MSFSYLQIYGIYHSDYYLHNFPHKDLFGQRMYSCNNYFGMRFWMLIWMSIKVHLRRHLDAIWMLFGCYLDAIWMLFGCHLGTFMNFASNFAS
ncbi:hypothetical protein RCL_jg12032.t1 [Rhizophagus clarus]|uniref:Uncharacterized protein n=1 Tax=Rhizophagus clarus TaxID=94130 RepID=A0A8H3QLY5_9GLOM|nr:hypothetical protein RCL_jg12032.t1 [Rhizophagus clarus]